MTVLINYKTAGGERAWCNGTCHDAKSPAKECTCACHGRYHGVGAAQAVAMFKQDVAEGMYAQAPEDWKLSDPSELGGKAKPQVADEDGENEQLPLPFDREQFDAENAVLGDSEAEAEDEIVDAWKCDACDAIFEEPNEAPLYECPECGDMFNRDNSADGSSHRCPNDNKFAGKIDKHSCPECEQGPLTQIRARKNADDELEEVEE